MAAAKKEGTLRIAQIVGGVGVMGDPQTHRQTRSHKSLGFRGSVRCCGARS